MTNRSLSPERLREAREAAGLNQRDAARTVGVSRGTIQNAEAGTSAPRAAALMRMADAYGVPIEFFFGPHEPEADTASTAHGKPRGGGSNANQIAAPVNAGG